MNYKEFSKILEDNINKGMYHESKKLPTEDELICEYNVTRYCARKAIENLVFQGWVYQVQGSGVFVRENAREGCLTLSSTKGIKGEFPDKDVQTILVQLFEHEAGEEIAKKMECSKDTKVYDIVRIRLVDGIRFAVEYTIYNKEIIPYIGREIVEDSIFDYIRNDLKLNIGFADKIISCEKLDFEASNLLHLEEGDPGLIIEDVAYLMNGTVFNVSKVIYNYKYAKFFNLADMN